MLLKKLHCLLSPFWGKLLQNSPSKNICPVRWNKLCTKKVLNLNKWKSSHFTFLLGKWSFSILLISSPAHTLDGISCHTKTKSRAEMAATLAVFYCSLYKPAHHHYIPVRKIKKHKTQNCSGLDNQLSNTHKTFIFLFWWTSLKKFNPNDCKLTCVNSMNALSARRFFLRNSTQWASRAGTAYFLAV